jgi:hypothetical protein
MSLEDAVVIAQHLVGRQHETPAVPWQHFDAVERRQVVDQCAADRVHPPVFKTTEECRIERTGATALPCGAAAEKTRPRYVEWIERDTQRRALSIVHLRIDQHPAEIVVAPVFDHPVFLVAARGEKGGKTAAYPRRDALVTQLCHQEQAVVAGCCRQASFRRAGDRQGAIIERRDGCQFCSSRAHLKCSVAIFGEG